MRIATCNVKSLTVRLPQLLAWLATNPVDVVAMQETKLTDDKFPHAEIEAAGYEVKWFGQKTCNGVALLSRTPADAVVRNIPGFADEQERAHYRALLGLGLYDAFRLSEQPPRSWSWWVYRNLAFRKNQGLRIDHILVSQALKSRVGACAIDKAPDRARHRSLLRLCKFIAGAWVLLSLAACCIGGACNQAPPPIPLPARSPSGAIAESTRCVMPAGSGGCKVTVIYSVQDGTNPTITVGAATPTPVAAGDGTLEVTVTGVGTTPVVLKNGDGTVLDNTKNIGSTCESWSNWNTIHRSCRYHYDRANLVVSGETLNETGKPWSNYVGYPQLIVGTTMTPLKNDAGVQVGACGLSSLLLPSGLPAAWCVKPRDGNLRGLFPVDPVQGLLLPEYTGPIPTGMAYYTAPYGPLGSSPYAALDIAYDGMFIDVPGVGTYYFTQARGDELRLTRDGFKTYQVMQSGQTFHVLMTYSHPAPCEPGFAWDTALVPQGQCSPKLCYAEAYLAISGRDMTPYQVSLAGRIKPVNMTDLPDVCAVSDTDIRCAYRCGYGSVDALGRVVFACQERKSTPGDMWAFSWKRFYWNPVANTWHRYGNEVLTGNPTSLGFVFDEDDPTLPPPHRNKTLAPALNGAFLSGLIYWDGGRVEASLEFLEDGKSGRTPIFYNNWALSNQEGYIHLLRTVRHVCTP